MIKSLQITPTAVFSFLLKVLAVLLVLNFVSLYTQYYLDIYGKSSYTLKTYVIHMFDFGGEKNIPTIFSAIILFASGSIALYISRLVKNQDEPVYYRQWFYLGLIFIFLALDELLMIHELVGSAVKAIGEETLQRSNWDVLHFSGLIPYITIIGLLTLFYAKFIFSLPKKTCVNFMVAGALFVLGAVGLELVESNLANSVGAYGIYSKVYSRLFVTVEESLEMFAIIFFIKGIIGYLITQGKSANLVLDLHVVKREEAVVASEVSTVYMSALQEEKEFELAT